MIARGLRLADHVLVRRAALGAMSEVYEGRHVDSGRPVAVKILRAEWCLHAEVVVRFLNEARALQRIRHPRVVEAIACGALPKGEPFMILEWLPEDLALMMARVGGALSARAALRMASQLADALAALHERGIVHRDLKPANVLLTQGDPDVAEVKLADLGLAKMLPEANDRAPATAEPLSALPISTGGSALMGTWEYMAPEQWIQSKRVDSKADVYALGVLLFQMLTGRLPFVAEQQQELMYLHVLERPPLDLLGGSVPVEARDLIARMLSKKPSPRPAMREVRERLAELP